MGPRRSPGLLSDRGHVPLRRTPSLRHGLRRSVRGELCDQTTAEG